MKCGSTKPRRDAQIRLDEEAVKLHRRAAGRGVAEIRKARLVSCEVIGHTHMVKHPRIADQFRQLGAPRSVGAARRHEHGDPVERNPGRHHGLNHRPQEEMVRDRPGDVADQDAGARPVTCELGQRRGADRVVRARGALRRPDHPCPEGRALRMIVGSAFGGRRTGSVARPKAISTRLVFECRMIGHPNRAGGVGRYRPARDTRLSIPWQTQPRHAGRLCETGLWIARSRKRTRDSVNRSRAPLRDRRLPPW